MSKGEEPRPANAPIDLGSPQLYINRELSQLEFNRRVLEQVKDPDVPLLERVRYLSISSSILDEFYEIRVAGLIQQVAYGSATHGPDNLLPAELLRLITNTAKELVVEQYRLLNDVLKPELRERGIWFSEPPEWTDKRRQWLKRYFHQDLAPILSPLGLDPAHPFPKVLNKGLAFVLTLEGKDAFGRASGKAVMQAPRSLPRVIQVPPEIAEVPHEFVFLSAIIEAFADDLFPGMTVTGCYQFRVTRNSDLFVDEEEVGDLLRALEGELPSRRFGDEVRLELAQNCPTELERFLVTQFGLTESDTYRCPGPVNLNRLEAIIDRVDHPDLKFPGFSPGLPPRVQGADNLFDVIRDGDVLLHHPFQSFNPVLDFLRNAARDPNVLSIRQTLYRTGADSSVVRNLIDAAERGKDVTVVIELRARFDEAANISLANRLQESGVQVVYGIVGHKTHSKMTLVIRREGRSLKRYVHLGTGNYHARTARLYTDYGLFTCDRAFGEDVQKVFHQLSAMGRPGRLKKLLQSPFTLHKSMLEFIGREAEAARAGKPARIKAKMNALTEPQIIQALYQASQAGVQIELIVRGMCALRPGVPGVSENISVRSIIGRFLEHTRVYYFENHGNPLVYLSSADWMGRSFFSRVETCFPVEGKRLIKRVVKESFDTYLADNTHAWLLQSDGSYRRHKQGNARPRDAQLILLQDLKDPGV